MIDIVKKYLDEKYVPDGYNLGWNVGTVAGQEVPYAHLHIIPRFKIGMNEVLLGVKQT